VLHKLDRKVTVSGQVRRPGTYQLLPGEGLKELIEYYGDGSNETGDPRNLELTRLSDMGADVARKQYVDYEEEKARNSTEIKPFDVVMVSSKLKMLPIVFFEGAIGQIEEGVRVDAANPAVLPVRNRAEAVFSNQEAGESDRGRVRLPQRLY
jgi:hypothetical protein